DASLDADITATEPPAADVPVDDADASLDVDITAADASVDAPAPTLTADAPVPEDSQPAPALLAAQDGETLSHARATLLEVYTGRHAQNRAIAGAPGQHGLLLRLADPPARLVDGRFARRLVFGD